MKDRVGFIDLKFIKTDYILFQSITFLLTFLHNAYFDNFY